MGRGGYLYCEETKLILYLGKAVGATNSESAKVAYFQIGDQMKNWEREPLTRALWKFLADHLGKEIRVALEDDVQDEDEYRVIGGTLGDAISFEEYLRNWPG